MKIKSIGAFERHIEKVILGLCVLVLLWAVYARLITSPVQAELGSRTVPPEQVDEELQQSKQALERSLAGGAPEELRQFNVPPYATQFREQLGQPLTPAPPLETVPAERLVMQMAPTDLALSPELPSGAGPQGTYRLVDAPMPEGMAVRANLGTLDPNAVDRDPEIRQALAGRGHRQPPYDLPFVSMAAQINAEELRTQLLQEEGDGQMIPPRWWGQVLAIADVQIERQRRLPDGSWSEPELIDPLPGRYDPRSVIDSATEQSAAEVARILQQHQADIVQPQWIQMRNQQWSPPEVELDSQADDDELESLQRRLEIIQRRMERMQEESRTGRGSASRRAEAQLNRLREQAQELQQQIRQAGGEARQPDRDVMAGRGRTPYAGGPDYGGPAAGYGGVYGGGPGPDGGTPMYDPGIYGGPGRGPAAPRERRRSDDELSQATDILTDSIVKLWAVDMGVEPGATYRYRMRIGLVNPLYVFKDRLSEEQAEQIGDQIVVFSEWTEWSEAVETLKTQYFFLASASEPLGQATVEVWKFAEGQWLQDSFSVRPGDPVGQTSSTHTPFMERVELRDVELPAPITGPVDFSTGAYTVDLDFEYLVSAGGLGSRETTRMLYLDGSDIQTKDLQTSIRQKRDLREKIIEASPTLKMMAEAIERQEQIEREERRREIAEQRERARRDRESRTPARSPGTPDYGGPGYGGPDYGGGNYY